MSHEHWSAPYRGRKPIHATVEIPGSKSVTNRALILAAQATSPSHLVRPLISRDSELMAGGLRAMGIEVSPDLTTVVPHALTGGVKIDVGNAGTVMRFLPPLAALADGEVFFDGDPRSHERPLAPVIRALEELGITIEHGGRYSLPMTVRGSGVMDGGEISIDASSSSQFLSALLLIAPSTSRGITVRHNGGELPSMPHIEMTVEMLRECGVDVKVDRARSTWSVLPASITGRTFSIEPDLSNAAPFLSIAMVCGGSVTIAGWPEKTTQPGDQLRQILALMGADVEWSSQGLTVTSTGKFSGIDIDLHDVGELTPAIAALAALADSPSHLRGIGHLRLHETDRLDALTREINALGGKVEQEESALHIFPVPLHGGIFHTYDDHRLATAGATLGLVVEGIEVENIATTRKTMTDFPALWMHALGM